MLAGNGLVLGCNDDGDSVEPIMTLDELRSRIHWANPMEAEAERERLLTEYPKIIGFDTTEEMLAYMKKEGL